MMRTDNVKSLKRVSVLDDTNACPEYIQMEIEVDMYFDEIIHTKDDRVNSNSGLADEIRRASERVTDDDITGEIQALEDFDKVMGTHPVIVASMKMITGFVSNNEKFTIAEVKKMIWTLRHSNIPVSMQFLIIVSLILVIISRSRSLVNSGQPGRLISIIIGFTLLSVMSITHAPFLLSVSVIAVTMKVAQRVLKDSLLDDKAISRNVLAIIATKMLVLSEMTIIVTIFAMCKTDLICLSVTAFLKLLV